ncbi:MAG: glycosyltransferase family 2 protein [Deltaproteobacteria bacterium]|nr:glycosyltransferase family 2 protein [Deltaproteobacteria bacterium]
MKRVNIVIPVYNEKGNIGRSLKKIKDEVTGPYQVTIVFDFDEDNSLPEAIEANGQLNLNLQFVKNKYGKGVLNAIKTGLHSSTAPYTIVTMADLSDPPYVINNMLQLAQKNNSDIVCGSRYMKDGSQSGGITLKSFLSRMAGLTLRYIAGVPTHDATNSFKLYSQRVLKNIKIESVGGFELGLELVVKSHLMGYKIDEVPTSWEDRSEGQSRFQLYNWIPKYLKWYFMAYVGKIKHFEFEKNA